MLLPKPRPIANAVNGQYKIIRVVLRCFDFSNGMFRFKLLLISLVKHSIFLNYPLNNPFQALFSSSLYLPVNEQ